MQRLSQMPSTSPRNPSPPVQQRLKKKVAAEAHRGEVTGGSSQRAFPSRCRSPGAAPRFLAQPEWKPARGKAARRRVPATTTGPGQGTQSSKRPPDRRDWVQSEGRRGQRKRKRKKKKREGTQRKFDPLKKKKFSSIHWSGKASFPWLKTSPGRNGKLMSAWMVFFSWFPIYSFANAVVWLQGSYIFPVRS